MLDVGVEFLLVGVCVFINFMLFKFLLICCFVFVKINEGRKGIRFRNGLILYLNGIILYF